MSVADRSTGTVGTPMVLIGIVLFYIGKGHPFAAMTIPIIAVCCLVEREYRSAMISLLPLVVVGLRWGIPGLGIPWSPPWLGICFGFGLVGFLLATLPRVPREVVAAAGALAIGLAAAGR